MLNKEFGFAEVDDGLLRFCIRVKPKFDVFTDSKEIISIKDKEKLHDPVPNLVPANDAASYLSGWFIRREGYNWTLYVDKYSNLKKDTLYEFYIT